MLASDFSKDALGTTGAQFLELPVGARAIAMGSAQAAVVQDVTALYYNPAGLAGVSGGSVALMHASYFQDISYQYGAAAQRLGDWGTLAAGVQYLSPGSLQEVDNTGAATGGSLTPNDLAASLGYGKSFGRVDLGAGVKYISSKIQDNASTYAADFGSRITFGRLALAAAVANLGPGLKFRETRDPLPTSLRLGAGYTLDRWQLALDVTTPRGAQPVLGVGTEYRCPKFKGISLAGRGGYNSRTASSRLGGMTGVNVGAGIEINSLAIDYAWSPYGDLGDAHRISVGYKWGVPRSSANAKTALSDESPSKTPASRQPNRSAKENTDMQTALRDLDATDYTTRFRAAVQLGKRGSAAAVAPLTSALEDQHYAVRAAAADALGKIGDSSALFPLVKLLDDPEPKVRALAAKALGHLKDSRARESLERLVRDEDEVVRREASAALEQLRNTGE